MKRISIVLSILIGLAGSLAAQTTWFANNTDGDDFIYNGLSPTTAKRSITSLLNTGTVQDGDTIYIAGGIYTDHPNISKNIIICGYRYAGSNDVFFNLTTASMNFTMNGTTKFCLHNSIIYNLTAADRFYFYGSDETGMILQSGKVELTTAFFQFEPPFMFQTPLSPPTGMTLNTWYVDYTNGDDVTMSGFSQYSAKRTIMGVVITGSLEDADIINIAGATYIDDPVIAKNVTINGHSFITFPDIAFQNNLTDFIFRMSGRTAFTAYAIGASQPAARFYFTGSTSLGMHFSSGCVQLVNIGFYMAYPYVLKSPAIPLTEISQNETLPAAFELQQCYPNPFNPSTTIRYSIRTAGRTTLKIFDMLGKEVAALVDGVQQPGTYEKTFDAGNLSSGVYLYRLQSGGSVLTKKLVLLR